MKRILFALALLVPTHAFAFDFPIGDTNTVDLNDCSGELCADVIVSPDAGNTATATPNGVYVPDTNTDDQQLTLDGDDILTLEDGGTPIDLSGFRSDPDPDVDPTNELGVFTFNGFAWEYRPNVSTSMGGTIPNGVSTDTDNDLTVGTDGLPYFDHVPSVPLVFGTDFTGTGTTGDPLEYSGDTDDTTQTFEITDFSIAGNSIEIAATGDDGGDDTATLPMATIDECGVATDPSHPVSAAQVRNFVEGERQAWRAGLEYPPDIWDDAALQALPVGVRVAGTTMTFDWTNPSACESAVVFLAARVGNTEFLNIADGNAIRVFYEQVGMNGDTIAEYDTQGQMPGSVTTSLNGSSFERRTATVAPGATITVSITPTIELKVPYNPQPNAEVSTRRVSYALLAVRVY